MSDPMDACDRRELDRLRERERIAEKYRTLQLKAERKFLGREWVAVASGFVGLMAFALAPEGSLLSGAGRLCAVSAWVASIALLWGAFLASQRRAAARDREEDAL